MSTLDGKCLLSSLPRIKMLVADIYCQQIMRISATTIRHELSWIPSEKIQPCLGYYLRWTLTFSDDFLGFTSYLKGKSMLTSYYVLS